MIRFRSATPFASFALLLAFLVAGCGSSQSDKKANESYANSVCTAVGNWRTEVRSVATDFSGGISRASLQSKASQIGSATTTLASELRTIPPPSTSEGQAARQQLDQLATDLSDTVTSVKTGIDGISANASVATLSAVTSTLAPQLQSLANEAESALTTLKNSASSWADAFDSASACRSLQR